MFSFADDEKLFSYAKTEEDSKQLQMQVIDTWLLSLNIGKCKSISYDRKINIFSKYTISSNVIEQVDKIKDLGV